MARYDHLPIYRASRELLREASLCIRDFPKDYRYTLGNKIQSEIVEMISLIVTANSKKRKKEVLEELAVRIAIVEALLMLAHDLRISAVSVKRLATLGNLIASIGKQCSGWLKRFGDRQPESVAATATSSAR